METYRLILELSGPTASPWHADTIWGHLCWIMLRRRGEGSIQAFLDAYRRGMPPLLLSDGFPSGSLPLPMLQVNTSIAERSKESSILGARQAKSASIAGSLVGYDAFMEICRSGEPVLRSQDELSASFSRRVALRNQIDRTTGTAAGESGALYAIEEHYTPVVDIYIRTLGDFVPTLRAMLSDLAVEGYGKRRGVGYGSIARWTLEPFDGFPPLPDADAFVSISRFVPAAEDPTHGRWRLAVKFGKVGGETAAPFKRPLIMLTPGSWFRVGGGVREWYGRIVPDISAAHPEVVHYGLAFAVPMRAPMEA